MTDPHRGVARATGRRPAPDPDGNPPTAVLLCLILVVGTLFASLRWDVGIVAVLLLVFAGVVLRFDARFHSFSDVLTVTRAAIDLVLAGGNPYGQGFDQSVPPGAPFAYGPIALLWYLPFRADPGQLEFAVSFVTLAILALRGRVLGLAIYASCPPSSRVPATAPTTPRWGCCCWSRSWLDPRAAIGAVLLAICVAFKPTPWPGSCRWSATRARRSCCRSRLRPSSAGYLRS